MIFKSLFGKIFLWFWLTMIAVVIMTAISAGVFHQKYGRDRFEAHFTATQAAYARAASAILEAEGLGALEQWLYQLRGPGGLPGRQIVLTEQGDILFGGRHTRAAGGTNKRIAELQAIIRESKEVGNKTVPAMPIERVFFEPIYHPSGDRYWFVSDMRIKRPGAGPRSMYSPRPHSWTILAMLAGVAVLVSGIVCFTLARYLTRPIRGLQAATKKIATGDFEARAPGANMTRGDELGELSRDFNNMAEKLQRLQQSQTALLRDVSHELRSPLARLQVALGLAEQRDDGRSAMALNRIEQELAVLDALVTQLLSVARLEAADESSENISVDLNELLGSICRDASFEGSEEQKQVEFTATGQATINADRSLLKSAFENIVRNALRHSPAGSKITVTNEHLSDASEIRVTVLDAGSGVPTEMLEDLFKPFVRVESARDRDSGGFGVGLAIASAAISRYKGAIKARNHESGGLEVTVTLPVNDTQL